MPHVFLRFPYSKASLALLEVLIAMSGVKLDLAELPTHAEEARRKMRQLLDRVEYRLRGGEELFKEYEDRFMDLFLKEQRGAIN